MASEKCLDRIEIPSFQILRVGLVALLRKVTMYLIRIGLPGLSTTFPFLTTVLLSWTCGTASTRRVTLAVAWIIYVRPINLLSNSDPTEHTCVDG